MFYGLITNFTYDNFRELLEQKDYDNFIYNCYYCFNQDEILDYLEKTLHTNNFVVNYIYIRNRYQLGHFKDPDVVRKCLSLAFRTIFIVMSHINICNEINKKFDILDVLIRKFEDKFKSYVTADIVEFSINLAKKDFLTFVDQMSSNITANGSPIIGKKNLDLPEPQLICNFIEGAWRYPALKYIKLDENSEKENENKFIKNYSARCQKYYDAYQYTLDKLRKILLEYESNGVFDMVKYF